MTSSSPHPSQSRAVPLSQLRRRPHSPSLQIQGFCCRLQPPLNSSDPPSTRAASSGENQCFERVRSLCSTGSRQPRLLLRRFHRRLQKSTYRSLFSAPPP
ncbi:hypothetical protein RHMOL_Rhmol03G0051500 [Rhododendron molle]|uniref:Uncharacterized protein n=1 Tax=Rhododendron molle TaxID=49168 RepID=A0ACC0PBY5_RHOML|nr:hypothetical protein RHMOL_Rhmol03G0051500 [Rhododendron molle]